MKLFILFMLYIFAIATNDIDGNVSQSEGGMKENAELKNGMAKMEEKMAKMEEKIAGQKEENDELKGKIGQLEKRIEEMALTIQNNAIEWMEYDWKAYNLVDHEPKLHISPGGLFTKQSGQNDVIVRAKLPIPAFNLENIYKPKIIFYFELQIVHKGDKNGICIGYCDHQFPLKHGSLGFEKNSIGFYWKSGMRNDLFWTGFNASSAFHEDEVHFNEGDFIGLGIIHQPNSEYEYFATWNGKLMGKAVLPRKFIGLRLFPAVNLYFPGDSVRVNYDKKKWCFKEFGRLLY